MKFPAAAFERFENRIEPEPNSGCWLWTGTIIHNGYGQAWVDGRNRYIHRVIYEVLRGPIPAGLTLDHRCRMRRCVNPAHLVPMTMRDNILLGAAPTAINARKTNCPRGHVLLGANLYRHRDGRRECRVCRNAANLRAYHRRAISS